MTVALFTTLPLDRYSSGTWNQQQALELLELSNKVYFFHEEGSNLAPC
jgi:hypothetical protein